jgi:hypothetical protein
MNDANETIAGLALLMSLVLATSGLAAHHFGALGVSAVGFALFASMIIGAVLTQ